MTIKVTKTQTVEEDVEITLPAFRRYLNGKTFYKIASDKLVIQADTYDSSAGIQVFHNSHMAKERLSDTAFEEITEEEFDNAFNQSMETLKQYQKEAV